MCGSSNAEMGERDELTGELENALCQRDLENDDTSRVFHNKLFSKKPLSLIRKNYANTHAERHKHASVVGSFVFIFPALTLDKCHVTFSQG